MYDFRFYQACRGQTQLVENWQWIDKKIEMIKTLRNCMLGHRGFYKVKTRLLKASHGLFFRWLIWQVCSVQFDPSSFWDVWKKHRQNCVFNVPWCSILYSYMCTLSCNMPGSKWMWWFFLFFFFLKSPQCYWNIH